MKRILIVIAILISPILSQCDWNEDGGISVLDVVYIIDCIHSDCWDGTQCDWNSDGIINILDIIQIINCILSDCWDEQVIGCTDPEAINYNPEATIDYGCSYYFSSVTDIEGTTYNTVLIGDHEWMAENLKVTHYQNGDDIPNIIDDFEWENLNFLGAYVDYNNESSNAEIFGRLYNWRAVDDPRNICPDDWHVPSDTEWTELISTIGGSYLGGNLKDIGTLQDGNGIWHSPNSGATNESGFTALPGGIRNYSAIFTQLSETGGFWSSTEYNALFAYYRYLRYNSSFITRTLTEINSGLSVRCIKAVDGCMNPEACNYNPEAVLDDGNCIYAEEYYDCAGNCLNDINEDGICDELEFHGCTDPIAINFNPEALFDDGNCEYIDIDGNIYTAIQIGTQIWMVENLMVTHYRNGDLIPTGFNGSEWGSLQDIGAYAIYPWDHDYGSLATCV